MPGRGRSRKAGFNSFNVLHARDAFVSRKAAASGVALAAMLPAPALAQSTTGWEQILPGLANPSVALAAVVIGATGFAVLSAAALIRTRNKLDSRLQQTNAELVDLRATLEEHENLMDAQDQRIVYWTSKRQPLVSGRLPDVAGTPTDRSKFLAFGNWLNADSSMAISERITALRDSGASFCIQIQTKKEKWLEARGVMVNGFPVVRFRDLNEDRSVRQALETQTAQQQHRLQLDEALLNNLAQMAWRRDASGRLIWVNTAYANAVGMESPEQAVAQQLELLEQSSRDEIARQQQQGGVFKGDMGTVIDGQRRQLRVVVCATPSGSIGSAEDIGEIHQIRKTLQQTIDSHTNTMDQLATAVAIFDAGQRLVFHNTAFETLFRLPPSLLEAKPNHERILTAMRSAERLPLDSDFTSWKAQILEAYKSSEAAESLWHLPGGETLRVVTNPHPKGGVTWIFENVTEQLELQTKVTALGRLQGETLENLHEAVAVFAMDGRLRLHNPAFLGLWHLDDDLGTQIHVNKLHEMVRNLGCDSDWERIRSAVTGHAEARRTHVGQMQRRDGTVVNYAMAPLSDGQTMLTFIDVTDSVNVERALTEKNEALHEAAEIKNAFVQHVSYELRAPLTSIIGFTQLISERGLENISEANRNEYVGYITESSKALLSIINDILDLASIDAGTMEIERGEIDVSHAVSAASTGLNDRLREKEIDLVAQIASNLGKFHGDEKRFRQVIYNLLANAIEFTGTGGKITVSATRQSDDFVLSVSDNGAGMSDEIAKQVFDRFCAHKTGSSSGGVGLGLSIVKSFVELHGGTVSLETEAGVGTTVTCRFPGAPEAVQIGVA